MPLTTNDVLRAPYSERKIFDFKLSRVWTCNIKLEKEHAAFLVNLLTLVADEQHTIGQKYAAEYDNGKSNLTGGEHAYFRDYARWLASHIETDMAKTGTVKLDMDTKAYLTKLLHLVATDHEWRSKMAARQTGYQPSTALWLAGHIEFMAGEDTGRQQERSSIRVFWWTAIVLAVTGWSLLVGLYFT